MKRKKYCLIMFALMVSFIISGVETNLLSKEKRQVIPQEAPKMAALRKAVDAEIDQLQSRLFEINDWMYHNPEPGYQEFKASAMLVEELKKHGFEVEIGVPGLVSNFDELKLIGGLPPEYLEPSGMPTAFKAKYKGKTEHPVVGIAVEYDALRGNPPFNGCQHNMQGPSGIGAAIALAKVMEKNKIPGSVWVIGTPAEEVGPLAKAHMAKTGYFDGIDFMARSHGTPTKTLRFPSGFAARHIWALEYEFHGKSAHGQSAWQGLSALDGVMLLFHGVDMLREHSEPQFRFHGVVGNGGVAPNIVPDLASASFWVRHLIDRTSVGSMSPMKAKKMIADKVVQMDNIAKGAALATGTTVDIIHHSECVPGISVGILNDIAFQYAVDYGGINIEEASMPNQWGESGFETIEVPGVSISVAAKGIPEVTGHSQENADITISPEGHKSLILTAKVMAAVHLRLIMDPEMRKNAKAEHAKWLKRYSE